MNAMKIGTKLMACAAVMLIPTLLLSYFALSAIGEFKQRYDQAATIGVRKTELSGNLVTANWEMIAAQRGIVLATFANDPADRTRNDTVLRQNAQIAQSVVAELEPMAVTAEGKALLGRLRQNEQEWLAHYEDLYRLCTGGDPAEANRMRKETIAPIYNQVDADARRLMSLQLSILGRDKDSLAALYSRTHWITFALIMLALVTAAGVGTVVRTVNRGLRKTIADLSTGAEQLAGAATQISSSSQQLAQGSSEQAASLEETSASAEEINAMAQKNTENSHAAADVVAQSQQTFEQTGRSLGEMVVAMDAIKAESGKISKIIRVIDEIAFQTNILALNAAVEAARAGEAGMGFAVVADEVRNLAQRCAAAAKDTAGLIEASISKANDGKAKVDEVAAAIQAVTAQAQQVKIMVDEVKMGSQEQARGVDQVARTVAQMQQVTQQTASSAEQGAAAAEELAGQSESLRAIVERLDAMVGANGSSRAAEAVGVRTPMRSAKAANR